MDDMDSDFDDAQPRDYDGGDGYEMDGAAEFDLGATPVEPPGPGTGGAHRTPPPAARYRMHGQTDSPVVERSRSQHGSPQLASPPTRGPARGGRSHQARPQDDTVTLAAVLAAVQSSERNTIARIVDVARIQDARNEALQCLN